MNKFEEYYGKNILVDTIYDKTIIEIKNSNIYIIEDLFDDKLCDEIVDIINKNNCILNVVTSLRNVECFSFYDINLFDDINYKDYYVFSANKNKYEELLKSVKKKGEITTNNVNGIIKQQFTELIQRINKNLLLFKSIISIKNADIIFQKHCGLCFRKIYGKTFLHIDNDLSDKGSKLVINNNVNYIRSASLIVALNDNYSGGIFEFPYYDIKIKLKKGSSILFPPYWTHLHNVTSVESGAFRYTINTWLMNEIKNDRI